MLAANTGTFSWGQSNLTFHERARIAEKRGALRWGGKDTQCHQNIYSDFYCENPLLDWKCIKRRLPRRTEECKSVLSALNVSEISLGNKHFGSKGSTSGSFWTEAQMDLQEDFKPSDWGLSCDWNIRQQEKNSLRCKHLAFSLITWNSLIINHLTKSWTQLLSPSKQTTNDGWWLHMTNWQNMPLLNTDCVNKSEEWLFCRNKLKQSHVLQTFSDLNF